MLPEDNRNVRVPSSYGNSLMKLLLSLLALCVIVPGGCAPDPSKAASPKPFSPSRSEIDIEALIKRAQDFLNRDHLDEADLEEFRGIHRLLALAAWENGSSLQETIRIISSYREDRAFIDWLHSGLNPYGKRGLLESNDALGASTTKVIAEQLIDSAIPYMKRLYLSLLRIHTSRGRRKEYLHLDADTVSKLIGEWGSLKDEKGRDGSPASSSLLRVYGHYAGVHPVAQDFLLGLIRDGTQPTPLRVRALGAGHWWNETSPERLKLVKQLLAPEEPSEIRVAAVGLLDPFFSIRPDEPESRTNFEILRELAEKDLDPKVRIEAGGGFIKLDDPKTIDWLAGILKREKNQEVRAGIISGFPLLGYENRETNYAALRLMAQLFKDERDAEMRKASVVRYLRLAHYSLVVWEEEADEASLDPVVLESLLGMVETIRTLPPGKDTRLEIKKRLELDFEKRFPDLPQIPQYIELKKFLDE